MAITAFRFGTAFSPLDYAPAIRIGNKHRIFISEYADYSYVVNSTIQKNGASDPANDTTTTPAGTYPGNFAFNGGVLLPDGRVFCVPPNSTSARMCSGDFSGASKNFQLLAVLSPYLNKF